MSRHINTLLALFVAFVFFQSLFFKFAELFGSPADITVYIFQTIGRWMTDSGLGQIGVLFIQYGGIVIGLAELLAGAMILYSPTRWFGALLGLGVISGALFCHLFTPLGLFPYTDLACTQVGCPTEKALFFMALGVWLCCATLLLRLRSAKPR